MRSLCHTQPFASLCSSGSSDARGSYVRGLSGLLLSDRLRRLALPLSLTALS